MFLISLSSEWTSFCQVCFSSCWLTKNSWTTSTYNNSFWMTEYSRTNETRIKIFTLSNTYIWKHPGHFTSMKNEFGVGTSLFNLCLLCSLSGVGCNKSSSKNPYIHISIYCSHFVLSVKIFYSYHFVSLLFSQHTKRKR